MPKEGENILKFNNFHKQQAVPFVIYADFEAITKKVQGCKPNDDTSYIEAYQTHEDCGYGYKVVCCYKNKYSKPIQTCRGENAIYEFMEKMLEEVEYCKAIAKKRFNKPLKMTEMTNCGCEYKRETVAMDIRLYVAMMVSTQSLLRCIGERML